MDRAAGSRRAPPHDHRNAPRVAGALLSRTTKWRERIEVIRSAGRHRVMRTFTPTGPTTARWNGREIVIACSNDYLGLAWDPEVRSATAGGGAGSSRLVSGTRPVHRALEEAVARWLGTEAALVLPSGWHANVAVFSTIVGEGDTVASDALAHASIIDGMRLSKAKRIVVPHASPQAIPDDTTLVAIEGLFSMDGDRPPLDRYPSSPWLAVDESHAVGCIGPRGRGVAASLGLLPDVIVGTFGKAFGAAGAFVAGSADLIELLVNEARSFIFTTGMAEPVAAMALKGLERATDERRERLAHNVRRLRSALLSLGWSPLGDAHIVPIVTGPDTMHVAERMLERGVFAAGIRWPTVPAGQERIRLTVSAEHTAEQIDLVAESLGPA
jgi:7-keto-8-aminopelargonate synthetase-like enzyme